jgi:2-polyprenyl-3-methyl-5-hydroxy-6-metoxy-1,4-benzoquinol methylase
MNAQPIANLVTSAFGNVWNKYVSNTAEVWDNMYEHKYAEKMDSSRQQARNYILAGIITSGGIPNPHVLDVGCGNGALLKVLRNQPSVYTGLDLSKQAIFQAQEDLSWTNSNFAVCDFRDFESDSGFDFIVLNEVLYYFPLDEVQSILAKAQRLLSPRGEVLISMSTNPKARWVWKRCLSYLEPRFELYVRSGSWNSWRLKAFSKQTVA